MTTADEIRAWTKANTRAKRAYSTTLAASNTTPKAAPKTDRQPGSGAGICERCGIDTTTLRRQKCNACRLYLRKLAQRRKETP